RVAKGRSGRCCSPGAGRRGGLSGPADGGVRGDAGGLGPATAVAVLAGVDGQAAAGSGTPVRDVHWVVSVAVDAGGVGGVHLVAGVRGVVVGAFDGAVVSDHAADVLRLRHRSPLRLGSAVPTAVRAGAGADRARVEHGGASGRVRGSAWATGPDLRRGSVAVRRRRRAGGADPDPGSEGFPGGVT